MERIWKVEVSGTPGSVTVIIPNSVVTVPISLITHSTDPSFPADANRSAFEMTDNGSDYTVTVILKNGDYFTFANAAETALPITLLRFNVVAKDKEVVITWATSSETNNDYFTIEKSSDGLAWTDFEEIPGAENSNLVIEYKAKDPFPYYGISYYRLKQTDFDGAFSYSDIVLVNFTQINKPGISIFPNPWDTSSPVMVKIEGFSGKEVLVELRDIIGKQFYTKIIVVDQDIKLLTIEPSGKVPSGTYLVTVTSDNSVYSKRIIVK